MSKTTGASAPTQLSKLTDLDLEREFVRVLKKLNGEQLWEAYKTLNDLCGDVSELPFHPDDTEDDDLAWADEKNPFLGSFPAETMSNCAQVLSIVDLATESQEMGTSDDEVMGYHLILLAVRKALWYHSTTKPEVDS